MDISLPSHKLTLTYTSVIRCLLGLLGLCAPACTLTPPPSSPPTPQPTISLTLTFPQAPTTLCQAATQLSLYPRIVGIWPNDTPITWHMTAKDGAPPLHQGTWTPTTAELLITFPNGDPLSPGSYNLTFYINAPDYEAPIAQHTFNITDTPVEITSLTLARAPTGPDLDYLPEATQHFYLRYTYQGICPGAPFWATVQHNEATICKHTLALNNAQGQGAVACYREDGQPLEKGIYQANLSLMGEAKRRLIFEVGQDPTPTPTLTLTPSPTPLPTSTSIPLVCDPPFTAAGLTPEGKPFLNQERFEWYTQSVYLGSYCTGLQTGITWETQWYRNGQLITQTYGIWEGPSQGVVWDSLTGRPREPFLLPGIYTASLEIANTHTLTAAFRLIAYTRPTAVP